eukprot:7529933-Alexandrium_andersonii.AAC.1
MHEVQCRGKEGTALRAARRQWAQVDVQAQRSRAARACAHTRHARLQTTGQPGHSHTPCNKSADE